MLAGLGLVAVANGLLLGLALYGLLRLVVEFFGSEPPWWGYGWLAGLLAGAALLALSLQRERMLREAEFGSGQELEEAPGAGEWENPVAARFHSLVEKGDLAYAPSLWSIEDSEPNAFAVGRNRDDASVVVTTGLLGLLEPEELDAVLAHEIAHVESEDLKAVGRADAVADSIDDLAEMKGRFFWGPKAILVDTLPFLIVFAVGGIVIELMPESAGNGWWRCFWPDLRWLGLRPFGKRQSCPGEGLPNSSSLSASSAR